MVSFPNAKINLGLRVLRKRQDGFHDIDSCFYPIPWYDILEIIPADQFSFTNTGLPIPGDSQNNLCVRAFDLLKQRFGINNVSIHLHKVIPMGAGLGGGSANGAFTLVSLNQLFDLRLSTSELGNIAAELGSDCPFFIENNAALVGGRGEQMKPASVKLARKWVLLINPNIHIPTAEAYAILNPDIPEIGVNEVLKMPTSDWQQYLVNDFEKPISGQHSEIQEIKKFMLDSGAFYSSMTGSGSTVFGLFDTEPTLEVSKEWTTFKTKLD